MEGTEKALAVCINSSNVSAEALGSVDLPHPRKSICNTSG
jgi:hypothetical protein